MGKSLNHRLGIEMAYDSLRTLNKYITNRILRRFARWKRGSFAVLYHIGRKSGKPYETTLMVWPVKDGFIIALTYGPEVDWYRNLLASGQGRLLWHGNTYQVGQPEPIDTEAALPALPPAFRQVLRKRGVSFIQVKIQ